MMGRRQRIKGGAEYDVLSGWRHVLCWCYRAGAKKSVKRQMNKRWRKEARHECGQYCHECGEYHVD